MTRSSPPNVTFIIPCPPTQTPQRAIDSLRQLDYPPKHLEVIVARGSNPSAQRNAAVARSHGTLLHFLDDDSAAHPGLMKAVLDAYDRFGDANVVGGPALTDRAQTNFQRSVGAALASGFGMGPTRYRYLAIGMPRPASERDLILCNLNVKRSTFRDEGGLDVRLYPNEENELLDRLRARGVRLIHHPMAVIYRPRRANPWAVFAQNSGYGRGRVEQFRLQPRAIDLTYTIPFFFLVYVLGLTSLPWLPKMWWPFALAPLVAYGLLSLTTAAFTAVVHRSLWHLLYLPMIFPLMHLGYATGMVRGAWRVLRGKSYRRPAGEVELVTVKRLDEDWATAPWVPAKTEAR